MKKMLVSVLCTIFLLVGCQRVEKTVDEQLIDVPIREIAIYKDSVFITDELEKKIFIDLYNDALNVYRWFTFSTMELNYDKPLPSNKEEQQHLYEIKDTSFTTMDDLRNYVSNYFSKDMVDELLKNQQLYKEVDGKLYGISADRGSDITKGDREVYKVIKIDDQNYVLRVEVDMVDPEYRMNVIGLDIVDYPILKIEDQYVFTQFSDIR